MAAWRLTFLMGVAVLAAPASSGGPAAVLWHAKISDTQGGFGGHLDPGDAFGISAAALGDLDGDGAGEIAVGASADDDGGDNFGAIWVLFLDAAGSVLSHQKICAVEGGFTGTLDVNDQFGWAVTGLGDLDGDDVEDVAVAAPADDDGGTQHGAVWVLFLNADGTVRTHQKISESEGGFGGPLDDFDHFGWSLATVGDLDGDDVTELAVGMPFDDDGGPQRGAVWVLFLNADGTVKTQQKISSVAGGFGGTLDDADLFGTSVTALGDLDGDGVEDLATGTGWDDDGGTNRGAVWVLFLNTDGTVKTHQKISDTQGGFTGDLDDSDSFGGAVAGIGDLDGDAIPDVAAGATGDDDGDVNHGAVWVLFLDTDGTVLSHGKISDTEGGFNGVLDGQDDFGSSLSWIGDPDFDGSKALAVGAHTDDDGGLDQGAAWVLFLAGLPECPADCADGGDGTVGTVDLLALLAGWGNPGACDVDGDGVIGTTDLLALLANWGICPQ